MKFRKKPVVIEAEQWWPGKQIEGVVTPMSRDYPLPPDPMHGTIKTLEGDHIVSPGDWIVTGVKKEKYPVKPDIFEQTYEKVEE